MPDASAARMLFRRFSRFGDAQPQTRNAVIGHFQYLGFGHVEVDHVAGRQDALRRVHQQAAHRIDVRVAELIEQRLDDEPMLTLALLVLYESFETAKPVETVEQDRVRMLRLADLYRTRGGPSLALVDTWVAKAKSPN